ncbi:MAG: cytochrome c biogenesis heme-transporting ATPase CcmA [Steroidobacteraceae bacterium]
MRPCRFDSGPGQTRQRTRPSILTVSSTSSTSLAVRDLHLWRGERHVVRGLSFELDAGRALQITWPNGAGKTSLLRALSGLLHVESGSIHWLGRSIFGDLRAFHDDMAFCSHEPGLKPDLTIDENLHFAAGVRRRCNINERHAALARVGLTGLQDDPARRLSAGQQRRVALARLCLQGATLWLLDEPAAHLDAQGQALVSQLVSEHVRAGGLALIATNQPLALAPDISDELPPARLAARAGPA